MNGDDDVFANALALPAAERTAFLATACQGDPAQRSRIEALLRAHARAQGILNAPLAPRIAPLQKEEPGDLIGRYRLRQKIGEGGCGVVWMAEQQEPVRRRVALKVIKLGMDTKAVVARFESERQALAMMDHPNIARVLDGGATEAGRPFFVMELVRGVRITTYCDEAALATRERLDLFIQVCQAIQHAHQKGIIHRDIKPSNILVTVNDGVAVPKVIDFGIAKATEGRLTDTTLITQFEALIGTPAYMSPEQTVMTSVDIDTRCDIYSLGVLLYELLTGRTPFETKELLASGLDAMRRTIRETEPVRPSTRMATLQGEELTTTARRRSADTSKLLHQIQGDLDWIVMKCLEKDRARRYATANGLATDLRRHLNHEPVTARPPGARYRFQKMVRRNKPVFVAAGAVTFAMVAGLSFSTWSFLRERQARERETVQRVAAVEAQGKAEAARVGEVEQRIKADAETFTAQRHLYAANMNLAQQAWEQTRPNLERVQQLLEETREFPGRGFEWFYWQRQTHLALTSLVSDSGTVYAVAYSPDGHRIVTGCYENTAKIWEAAAGQELFALHGHNASVSSVAFSPDGRRIVTGSNDHTIKVWNATGGPELFTLTGHRGPVTSVAFSPDGQRIVSGSQDYSAKLWAVANGPALLTLEGHNAPIWSVDFSPDGQRIVTGGGMAIGRGTQPAIGQERLTVMAKVWEARSGRELFTLRGHTRPIRSLAISPNGQWIVTASGDGTAKLWDAASGQELRTLTGHSSQIWAVAFSPDSQRIVTGCHDQTVRVWDAGSGRELHTLRGHRINIASVAFSPDGGRIVSGGWDNTAKVWDATKGSGPIMLKGHGAQIGSVAFSPDGHRIVTGSNDGTAKVWEAASGQVLHTLKGHGARIASVAFSPDGRWIVTGSHDNTARVWEAASGREERTLAGHSAPILSAAFSPDGQQIVTGSTDRTAKMWEAATGRPKFTINGHTAPIASVAYSPDGRSIVTGSDDKTAKVWTASDGRELFTLKGHTSAILAVAFSPDGQSIVTGSTDRTAKVWATASGQERLTIMAHPAPITSVAYSPDSQRIVTGSDDKTATVWEATSGQALLTLNGHRERVGSVAFSPDGRQILTGSDDRTAGVWRAASPEQVSAWLEKEQVEAGHLAALKRVQTEKEERRRITHARDEGAIKRWLILAPIPLSATLTYSQGFEQGLDSEQIAGESRITPKAGQRAAVVGGELTWRELVQEDYVIDFIAFMGRVTELSVGYAVCYVRSEARQSGLRLLVGIDSRAKVYLNETLVHEYRFGRGFIPDRDTVNNITLNAGRNVLIFKVVINEGALAWRDSIRFTDAQGNPVKGITVTLDP